MATSTPNIPTSFPSPNAQISSLFTAFFLFLLLPIASSDYFQVTDFSRATNITIQGDAATVGAAADSNSTISPTQCGWATYAEKVQLWDSETGSLYDFATNFSFIIDTQGSSTYGDGIAFFLAPFGSPIDPESFGGYMGLFSNYSSKNQIVMVEFDTYYNNGWDPAYRHPEHIGININSISSVTTTQWINASLYSGQTCNASITYNASKYNLSVFWSYGGNSLAWEAKSSLSYPVDLSECLPEWVMVGFSSSTGGYVEKNTLQSWAFNSSLDPTARRKHKKYRTLIVGLTVSMVVLILGAAIFIGSAIARKRSHVRWKRTEKTNLASITDAIERGAGPRMFSYADLVSATSNFSDERKLGQGGFGCVYRGYLNDLYIAVAVKKISRGSKQGKKEYTAEVKIISRLRHRNLVQLIGYCHDKGEFLLVYELMPNGSLDAHLFGNKKIPLTWAVRYKITLGLASALFYLHEEWEQCVVHRDIKSSNVMLDSDFNVKLGDFGLARLVDHELGPQTTGLAGTFGYMAPEYIRTGRASKEADVFSFGVVVLEIASGRKSVNPREGEMEVGLVEWVWDLYGKGQILSAIDERMKSNFDAKEVECLMIAGLWCAYPDHSRRPSIRHAIQVLHFEAALPHLPTQMPVPTYHAPAAAGCSRVTPEEPLRHSGEVIISTSSIEMGR